MAHLTVTFNADQTITVRAGRAVEHISTEGKTKLEIFEAVKWVSISKGVRMSDIKITELLWNRS